MVGETSGRWQWIRDGETVAAIDYKACLGDTEGTLQLFYTWAYDGEPQDVICPIRLSSLPLYYGGRRWYLHCPYTNRRALVL